MAITVELFTFSKRENSTRRPTAETENYTLTYCNLKHNCGVVSPALLFQLDGDPAKYNYVRIPGWGRYYWITEWTWEPNGLWRADCKVDVLASWYADYLANQTFYVVRSATQYDLGIIDTDYPLYPQPTYSSVSSLMVDGWEIDPDTQPDNDLKYIVGIAGKGSHSIGGVHYYKMSKSQIANLINYMLPDIEAWDSITDFTGDIAKAFVSPLDYIKSCTYFPFGLGGGTFDLPITFGFWDTGLTGHTMLFITNTYTFNLTVPKSKDNRLWLRSSPYSQYRLVAQPWGVFSFPGEALMNTTTMVGEIKLDLITGLGVLNLYRDSVSQGNLIDSRTAQIGTPIQLSTINFNYQNLVGGGAAGLIETGVRAATSMISGQGVGDAITTIAQEPKTVGTTGGFVGTSINNLATLILESYTTVQENLADNGRPTCKQLQLSSLDGYVRLMDADVRVPATAAELNELKQIMESGFFIEGD